MTISPQIRLPVTRSLLANGQSLQGLTVVAVPEEQFSIRRSRHDKIAVRSDVDAVEPTGGSSEVAKVATVRRRVHANQPITATGDDIVSLSDVPDGRHMLTKIRNRAFLVSRLGIPDFDRVICRCRNQRAAIALPGESQYIIRVPFQTPVLLAAGHIERPDVLVSRRRRDAFPIGRKPSRVHDIIMRLRQEQLQRPIRHVEDQQFTAARRNASCNK
jgi:hypothetical protein